MKSNIQNQQDSNTDTEIDAHLVLPGGGQLSACCDLPTEDTILCHPIPDPHSITLSSLLFQESSSSGKLVHYHTYRIISTCQESY
mmetsp:Transcript_17193/g.39852  ORF Transcript_17193/g.39852 Transcript_17193/m.39852 type:complete len:85 (-) Transcript_17193:1017-1271(-)